MPSLPFISEAPEFKPRRHIGQDTGLPKIQSDMIDALDVNEQKSDWAVDTARRTYNAVWILGAFHVIGVVAIVAVMKNTSALGAVIKIFQSFLP